MLLLSLSYSPAWSVTLSSNGSSSSQSLSFSHAHTRNSKATQARSCIALLVLLLNRIWATKKEEILRVEVLILCWHCSVFECFIAQKVRIKITIFLKRTCAEIPCEKVRVKIAASLTFAIILCLNCSTIGYKLVLLLFC